MRRLLRILFKPGFLKPGAGSRPNGVIPGAPGVPVEMTLEAGTKVFQRGDA